MSTDGHIAESNASKAFMMESDSPQTADSR